MMKTFRLLALGFSPVILMLLFFPMKAHAQEGKNSFRFEQIFGKERKGLTGTLPRIVKWLPGGEGFIYRDKDPKDKKTKLWTLDGKSGKNSLFLDPETVEAAYQKLTGVKGKFPLSGYSFFPDMKRMLFSFKGVLYLYSLEEKTMRLLSACYAPLRYATPSSDGKYVAYVRENNLYALEVDSGLELQLTADGGEAVLNGVHSWVYYEELFDRDYRAFWWSPDSSHIAFFRYDESSVFEMTMLNLVRTRPETILQHYPKAGMDDPVVSLFIIRMKDRKLIPVNTQRTPKDYLVKTTWMPDGSSLGVQTMTRDHTTIRLLLANPQTGICRLLLEEKQKEWVDTRESMRFLKDGSHFLWPSDRDGWNHLYLYDMEGNLVRRLTEGNWSVLSVVRVDEEEGFLYFTANEKSPLEKYLYRVRLKGTGFQRLTKREGSHTINMPPEATCYLDRCSTIAEPGRLDLYDNSGSFVRTLQTIATDKLAACGFVSPEFFNFKTEDGMVLPGWVLRPSRLKKGEKAPLLVAIYGGPGSQSVANSWRGTTGLWYQYLAQQGIAVAVIDHRGSAHFGKEGAVKMHRRLGYWEVKDYAAGVEFLVSLGFVDPKRVAIWGWSYGGYVACHALVKAPETFSVGVAVAPVTAWENYDTIYTEAYMDTPLENPKGYKESSPVTHAAKLEGRLLLIHGTRDDNVHFQNTVQLLNAFIHEGKQVDVMFYPNRTHGIASDKARPHLFRKVTDYLLQHLQVNK